MGREGSGGLHRASEPGGKGSQRCFPSRHLPTGDRGATSARSCYVGFNVAARGLEKSLQSRHQPTSRKRISLGVARSPTNINLMHSPPTTRFALMGSPFAGRRFQFSYDNHLKSCAPTNLAIVFWNAAQTGGIGKRDGFVTHCTHRCEHTVIRPSTDDADNRPGPHRRRPHRHRLHRLLPHSGYPAT